MVLKDAYRAVNLLKGYLNSVNRFLSDQNNIASTESQHMRTKFDKDAIDENETTLSKVHDFEFDCSVMDVVDFGQDLLKELEECKNAIDKAKAGFTSHSEESFDIDACISSNVARQEFAGTLKRMCSLKSTESVRQGTGSRINVNGDQSRYTYEVKDVKTIDFDRNKVNSIQKKLLDTCDAASNTVEMLQISIIVDYKLKYNFNDSWIESLEKFVDSTK